MKIKKEKRPRALIRAIIYILHGVFLHIVGSWGAFVIDENENFIEKQLGGAM